MKYAWMDEQGKAFALTEMCAVLDISISGYRAWKRGGTPDRKWLTDAQMLAHIRAIHGLAAGNSTNTAHEQAAQWRKAVTQGSQATVTITTPTTRWQAAG